MEHRTAGATRALRRRPHPDPDPTSRQRRDDKDGCKPAVRPSDVRRSTGGSVCAARTGNNARAQATGHPTPRMRNTCRAPAGTLGGWGPPVRSPRARQGGREGNPDPVRVSQREPRPEPSPSAASDSAARIWWLLAPARRPGHPMSRARAPTRAPAWPLARPVPSRPVRAVSLRHRTKAAGRARQRCWPGRAGCPRLEVAGVLDVRTATGPSVTAAGLCGFYRSRQHACVRPLPIDPDSRPPISPRRT